MKTLLIAALAAAGLMTCACTSQHNPAPPAGAAAAVSGTAMAAARTAAGMSLRISDSPCQERTLEGLGELTARYARRGHGGRAVACPLKGGYYHSHGWQVPALDHPAAPGGQAGPGA